MNQEVFVGIDICQSYLDVYITLEAQSYRFDNNQTGVTALVDILQALQPELVILESTGGLERLVISELQAAQILVAMVNPRKVRAYGIALGKVKTDTIDAQVLADFGRAVRPSPIQPIDETSQKLADLVSRRRQLVEMRVAEKNRLSRASADIIQDIEQHIDYLNQRIDQLNQDIEKLTEKADFSSKQKILMSAPGIGPATCAVCLAELPELGSLTQKQIARLVGVAPVNRSGWSISRPTND